MSRDREAAFFDRLHDWDANHRVLSFVGAWLLLVAALTLTCIGPFVGTFAYDWLFGLDPNNGGQIAVAWFGGGAALASLVYAGVGVHTLVRK